MSLITVPFTIMADTGVVEGGTAFSPTATVKFKVPWSQRATFVNQVCGTVVGGDGSVSRTVPWQYPPSPNLFATADFLVEPLGKLMADASWVYYPYAVVTIVFAVPPYGMLDGSGDASGLPWTTTTFEVGGEFLTLPDSAYKFAGGIPIAAPVGQIIPQIAISFKRHWVPFLPVAEVFNLAGTVNAAGFPLGGFTCPPETLLFLGSSNTRNSTITGGVSQEVEYKMSYRSISWNKFLMPDGSGFAYIFDKNGNKVYAAGDFTTLP